MEVSLLFSRSFGEFGKFCDVFHENMFELLFLTFTLVTHTYIICLYPPPPPPHLSIIKKVREKKAGYVAPRNKAVFLSAHESAR